jgi:sugar phosphate isomerase/epimerase
MATNRRKFLKTTVAAGSAFVLSPFDSFAKPIQPTYMSAGFSLKIMATNWGFDGNADDFCKKVREAGYDGIEVWMPDDEKGRHEIANAASKNNLLVGILYGGGDKDFQKHLNQFKTGINAAVTLKPIYINCHSGRDFFSYDQNKAFIDFTTQLNKQTGIPIYHETHRGRSQFAAPITRRFIDGIPELRLTFDVSHWCNVHESLLGDQEENISLALDRTDHIHARIGHAEGPQVSDPRAPEWEHAMKAHFAWWDKVVERKKKEGKTLTILTEFGPPDYLPTLPYTRQPVANQWDINIYMLNVLKKRYA